jgi:hypothetical protein
LGLFAAEGHAHLFFGDCLMSYNRGIPGPSSAIGTTQLQSDSRRRSRQRQAASIAALRQGLAQFRRAAGGFRHQKSDIRMGCHETHALANEAGLPYHIPITAKARELSLRDGNRDHMVDRAHGFGVAECAGPRASTRIAKSVAALRRKRKEDVGRTFLLSGRTHRCKIARNIDPSLKSPSTLISLRKIGFFAVEFRVRP